MKRRSFLRKLVPGIFALSPLAALASCNIIDADSLNEYFGTKSESTEAQRDPKLEQLEQKNVELSNQSSTLELKVAQLTQDQQELLKKNEESQGAFESLKKSLEENQLNENKQKDASLLGSDLYRAYVSNKYELGRIEAEKKITTQRLKEAQEAYESVKNAYKLASKAKETFLEIQKLEEIFAKNQRLLRMAKEDYLSAYRNNWFFGKEVALYLFSLKPLWGLFTGYAASTSTSQQWKNLEQQRVATKVNNNELRTKIESARQELESVLAAMPEAFENSAKKALSAENRIALGNFKNQLLLTFAEVDSARRGALHQEEIFHEALKVKDFAEFNQENYNLFEENFNAALAQLEAKRARLFSLFEENNPSSFTTLIQKRASEVTNLENRVEELNSKRVNISREISIMLLQYPRLEYIFRNIDSKISALQLTVNNFKNRAQEIEVQLEEKNAFLKALEQAYEAANRTRVAFEGILESYKREDEAAFKVLIKEKELQLAYQNNHRFGKEFALYTLGFKWLWGIFTGYARNPDVAQELAALEEAKKMQMEVAAQQNREHAIATKNVLELKNQTLTLLEQAALRAKTVAQKTALLKLETLFEESLEGFKRTFESTREAFDELARYLLSDRFSLRLTEDKLFSKEVLNTYESKLSRAQYDRGEFDRLFKSEFNQLFSDSVREVDTLNEELYKTKVGFEESFNLLLTTKEKETKETKTN